MLYEKTYRPSFTMVGDAGLVSSARPDAPDAIEAFWQRFYREKVTTRVLERTNDSVYALYCDYENDHTGEYTMVLGFEVPPDGFLANNILEGLAVMVVPTATYAVPQLHLRF